MLDTFRSLYGSTEGARVFRAPGRVNLIGEHTDYNLGLVLPVALDLTTSVVSAPAAGAALRIHSEHRGETRQWNVAGLYGLQPAHDWTDYPIGVARELIAAGFPIAGANLLIRSTVPEGSGLSSSAALEVSSALAFLQGRAIDPVDLALLCQRAERGFVGMPCGIMDQYVSVFGRDHCAIEIDCRSLDHRATPLPAGAAFVIVNTMVKHSLAGSAYRDRVAECAAAVAALHGKLSTIESLRDVSPPQLESFIDLLDPVVARRARHVVTENQRVADFVAAASSGDLPGMGRLMAESHRSLQHDYEVSCDELDFLVDTALSLDGVYGSRMTGGGFGGCTVTLLTPGAEPEFRGAITRAYQARFEITPQIFPCHPSSGAAEVAVTAGP